MNIDNDLIITFASYYQKMQQEGKTYIPDTGVAKEVLIPMYDRLVKEGLKPIEELTKEEKMELVAECRKDGKKYTNETLIEQSKILYLLKKIT